MKLKERNFEIEEPRAKRSIGFSDDALALKFVKQHGGDWRYVSARGTWFLWNGMIWQPDTTIHVFDLVRRICRAQSLRCHDRHAATRIASSSTITAVERLARSDRRLAATDEQWDQDPWVLNTPTGVVDLRTGIIRAPLREDYMTKLTSVGAGDVCLLWESFLERVTGGDREFQRFVQRMCGYILTGVTREHALFFLFGHGANGKSVFLNTISGILGDYSRTAPLQMLISSNYDRHPTELASLECARLVSSTEIDDGASWDEPKIKALTGGDRIAARRMRQDFFQYIPQFKLLISGNHKPSLRTVDEAIRRRFVLLPFSLTIPASERDPELTEKLRSEWSGILKWMIEGCIAWQAEGLNPPGVVRDATESYFDQEDAIDRWIRECCDNAVESWTAVADLYDSYLRWCQRNHERPRSKNKFSGTLESKGFKFKRTGKSRGFYGPSPVTDVTHVSFNNVGE